MDIYKVLKASIIDVNEKEARFDTDSGIKVSLSGNNISDLKVLPTETLYILVLSSQIYQDFLTNNAVNTLNKILAGEI